MDRGWDGRGLTVKEVLLICCDVDSLELWRGEVLAL